MSYAILVPLQKVNSMATNKQIATMVKAAAPAPTYAFVTGASPKVKLPSFQFGSFDPNSLQFGSFKELPELVIT